MDTDQQEQGVHDLTGISSAAIIKASLLFVLFMIPLGYLYYKTNSIDHLLHQPAAVQAPADIATLEKEVKTNPTFDNLIKLSLLYIDRKMPAKSIPYLKQAIQLNGNNAVAYNNLGFAYTMMQQYQNGIDACTKALQIDPNFRLAKNNLKWAMDEKNKIEAAIHDLEATPEDKRNAAFYISDGLYYFKMGDYDKSIMIWKKVLDKEPGNTAALNNIGTSLMMKGQYDDAIALFSKVLQLDPQNQLGRNNLNWAVEEKNSK